MSYGIRDEREWSEVVRQGAGGGGERVGGVIEGRREDGKDGRNRGNKKSRKGENRKKRKMEETKIYEKMRKK